MNDIVFLGEFFTNYESIEWPKKMGPSGYFRVNFLVDRTNWIGALLAGQYEDTCLW